MKQVSCTILFLVIASLVLNGCTSLNTPPSAADVKQHLFSNHEAILFVMEYMVGTGYNDIIIRDASGMIWADFEEVKIHNEDVVTALRHILTVYKSIIKQGTTITLVQWTGFRDIGCGLCYSLLPSTLPEVAYAVELVKITESGWYYYVDDYEKWRAEKSVHISQMIGN